MEFIDTFWFYPVAVLAVGFSGMSKTGFGMAGGLSVPLLALVIAPTQAAAVMLPILIAMDVASVYAYRRDWSRENMRIILPAGLLGTAIGWATFRFLNDNAIRVILGAIAVGFAANNWLRGGEVASKPSRVKGYFWATVSGLTSFVAHAGGPPLLIYLLPQRLQKKLQVGTTVVFFAALNAAKVLPYLSLGLFDATNIATSLVLLPVALIGIVIGLWVQRRLPTDWFFRITYALLFLAGLKLLYDGISAI